MQAIPVEFLERFLLNAVVLVVLLRFIYYRFSANRDSLFGFFLFGHGVYMISALLHDVDVSLGFAFGLFAVLSMLRYRTESLAIRDMTYLFIVIVISLMSAVAPISLLYLGLLNGLLCMLALLCETSFFAPRTVHKTIVYDNTVNIRPENRETLIRDLEQRLGTQVVDVSVGEVDFLKDAAQLQVSVVAVGNHAPVAVTGQSLGRTDPQ